VSPVAGVPAARPDCSSRRITERLAIRGPAEAAYDNAGYTLAYQMGVQFDRMLEPFDCPCERIAGLASPAPGTVRIARVRFVLSPADDAFHALAGCSRAARPSRAHAPLTSNGKTYHRGSSTLASGGP